MNQYEQLQRYGTIIVADTGDIEEIKKIKPQDATTNPSLILKAVRDEKYQDFITLVLFKMGQRVLITYKSIIIPK